MWGKTGTKTTMEYVDGSGGRQEAYGGSKREAKVNLEENLRSGIMRFDMASRSGQVT